MPNPVTRLNAALEGRYRTEREIGEGGMATVYLRIELTANRPRLCRADRSSPPRTPTGNEGKRRTQIGKRVHV